ncbi:serine hydrolase domain-containing protein [Roseibium algae]|uniref:Serine hydrolase domain-containing protein n=1 Tax=Roseibium algae TaxID=3123038 RepID=A0ABU8THY6_9HYPH
MNAPDGFRRQRPGSGDGEAHGTDPAVLLDLLDEIAREKLELHSLLIWQHGTLILEAYWQPYGPDRLHMMHSVTKSFTSMAVGLAFDDGLLSLDDRVIDYFPEFLATAAQGIETMRLRHVLTMTSGHGRGISGGAWRKLSSSWAEDFLSQPIVHTPGDVFVYDSACSYMLAAIVQRVVGRTVHDYLRERIFNPMGLTQEIRWDLSPEGVNSGGNGLWCRSSDLLNLGLLHLQDGQWCGKQLLSSEWVRAAKGMQVRDVSLGFLTGEAYLGPEESFGGVSAERREGYGFQWWRGPNESFSASGLFGQSCIVFEQKNAVIAFTAGIDDEDRRLLNMIHKDLYPALGQWRGAELPARLDALEVAPPPRADGTVAPASWQGLYHAENNDQGITSVSLAHEAQGVRIEIVDERGCHSILAGIGQRLEGTTTIAEPRLHHAYEFGEGARVAAWAAWQPATKDGWACLVFDWVLVETAFRDTARCYFKDGCLRLQREVNVNSSIRILPEIRATLQSEKALASGETLP